jgi:excisionase family DNA binding protein
VGEEYLRPKQAAEYLNVSPRTFYNLVVKGLPIVKISETVGGGVITKRSWIDEWMESQRR